jgi:hypothetical protein
MCINGLSMGQEVSQKNAFHVPEALAMIFAIERVCLNFHGFCRKAGMMPFLRLLLTLWCVG